MHMYYGEDEGALKNLTPPRYLYLLKSNSAFKIVFTKYRSNQLHLIEQSFFRNNFEIVFDSYMGGEYTTHPIHNELFPLLNHLLPSEHYSNQLIRTYKQEEEEHYLATVEQWGSDLVDFINRTACSFITQRYFTNPIELITDKEIAKNGNGLVEMISDVSFFVAPAKIDIKLRILSTQVDCYGKELVSFTLETCENYYSSLKSRFSEAAFIYHLNASDHSFMKHYRNIY